MKCIQIGSKIINVNEISSIDHRNISSDFHAVLIKLKGKREEINIATFEIIPHAPELHEEKAKDVISKLKQYLNIEVVYVSGGIM